MKTYVIGRAQYADIVIADSAVAARHAELVVSGEAVLHLTDCNSGNGTWLLRSGADGEEWVAVRQEFVLASDTVRFGEYVCTVGSLLKGEDEEHVVPSAPPVGGGGTDNARTLPRGRVERDPRTGEIVRKRL